SRSTGIAKAEPVSPWVRTRLTVTGARDFTLKNVSQGLRPSMADWSSTNAVRFVGVQMALFSIAPRVGRELLGVTCGRSNLTRFQPAEKLPSYRRHSRELRQSNPEIRRMPGFFSRVLTAPSLCAASNVPSHSQKGRKMIVF